MKQSKKIFSRLLSNFYKNSYCLFKHQKQKRRQKTNDLIDDLTFSNLQKVNKFLSIRKMSKNS